MAFRKLAFTFMLGIFMVAPALPANAQSQVCVRLERELARLSSLQNSRANQQVTSYSNAVNEQQQNIGIMRRQMRRGGCAPDPAMAMQGSGQCRAMAQRLIDMERNLQTLESRLSRMRGGRDYSRQIRGIQADIQRNQCGVQPTRVRAVPDDYIRYPNDATRSENRYPNDQTRFNGGGIFNNRWGGDDRLSPEQMEAIERAKQNYRGRSNTVRTICVRTCDGFYFPISFSTIRANLEEDAQKCQAQCPGTEAKLFYHSNPGEDPEFSVSTDGTRYMELENASRYQREFVSDCSCHTPQMLAEYENMSPRSDQPVEMSLQQRLAALKNAPLPPRRGEADEIAQQLEQDAERKIRVILSYPAIEKKAWDAQLAAGARPVPAREPAL